MAKRGEWAPLAGGSTRTPRSEVRGRAGCNKSPGRRARDVVHGVGGGSNTSPAPLRRE